MAEIQSAEPVVEPDPTLMRAAEMLRGSWGQGNDGSSPPPGMLCIYLAIPTLNAMGKLLCSLGLGSVEELFLWNDAPGRTEDEVIEALERAAVGL
jgi:hypothetical protein